MPHTWRRTLTLSAVFALALADFGVNTHFTATEPVEIGLMYRDHPNYPITNPASDWVVISAIEENNNVTFDLTNVGSRDLYESYTAPLGACFIVTPHTHYGPNIDGYEYSPWGTYHFADRDGIGVDRTRATGSGFTGQCPEPWATVYENLATCPDELLLFFHHVPYDHRLHSGVTLIQQVYDTHVDGAERAAALPERWALLRGLIDDAFVDRVAERVAEQVRSAAEWRDQVTTYFWRHAGLPDARGRIAYY